VSEIIITVGRDMYFINKMDLFDLFKEFSAVFKVE